jgi:hypothetical protein
VNNNTNKKMQCDLAHSSMVDAGSSLEAFRVSFLQLKTPWWYLAGVAACRSRLMSVVTDVHCPIVRQILVYEVVPFESRLWEYTDDIFCAALCVGR